jgi:hypothetical protein
LPQRIAAAHPASIGAASIARAPLTAVLIAAAPAAVAARSRVAATSAPSHLRVQSRYRGVLHCDRALQRRVARLGVGQRGAELRRLGARRVALMKQQRAVTQRSRDQQRDRHRPP